MPQASPAYAIARIRCHEKDLISQERMLRLSDLSFEEILRQLQDLGYGALNDMDPDTDAESLIEAERLEAAALVKELSFQPEVTDIFLLRTDVHNLKLLLKLRLTQSREEALCLSGGIYPVESLKTMVREMDYRALPAPFRKALTELELSFLSAVDPVMVSVLLDKAYVEYALISKDPFVREYFKARADFDNILCLLRLRNMKASIERIKACLLPEGNIPQSRILSAAELPLDSLGKALATGPAWDSILKGLEAVNATGRISILERSRDNYLMSLCRQLKYQQNSIGPLVGYLLAREQEGKCIRLLLRAKRNGLEESIITERLRELYV